MQLNQLFTLSFRMINKWVHEEGNLADILTLYTKGKQEGNEPSHQCTATARAPALPLV